MRSEIRFVKSGKHHVIKGLSPDMSVLDYVREETGLTGTKEGCNEGDCGACTVILAHLDENDEFQFRAINACVALIHTLDAHWLITVEDLHTNDQEMHPVQTAMVTHHASQCGFCTPGIVMSLTALHNNQPNGDTDNAIHSTLAGNLCRCTGYGPIIASGKSALSKPVSESWKSEKILARKLLKQLDTDESLEIVIDDKLLFAPRTETEFAKFYEANPDCTIIGGTTDVGLWLTKRMDDIPKFLATGRVVDFQKISESDTHLSFGSAITLTQFWQKIHSEYPELKDWFERYASKQIRNVATLIGNIANASPIGDSPPVFLTLGTEIELKTSQSSRWVKLEDYFIAYGKQARQKNEYIAQVRIPKRHQDQNILVHKISRRKDQDITTSLIAISWIEQGNTKSNVKIAAGGMAGIPKLALHTMELFEKDRDDLPKPHEIRAALIKDYQPIDDLRADASYRTQVFANIVISTLLDEEAAFVSDQELAS